MSLSPADVLRPRPKGRHIPADRVSEREAWWLDWCSTSKRYGGLLSCIEVTEYDLEKMEVTGSATPELESAFEERLGL